MIFMGKSWHNYTKFRKLEGIYWIAMDVVENFNCSGDKVSIVVGENQKHVDVD